MAGYFKVPMDAAKHLVNVSDGPELLAGYIVLHKFAMRPHHTLTAAGARSIRIATGVSDFRSKRILSELRELRMGDRGELGFVVDTTKTLRNAKLKMLPRWDGLHAYVPSLFVNVHPEHGSPLLNIMRCGMEPEQKRDALLVMLQLYASTDYGGWMGAPPDLFPFQVWEQEGVREVNDLPVELGETYGSSALRLWAVSPPQEDAWKFPQRQQMDVFDSISGPNHGRIAKALWCLLATSTVCKVAVVSHSGGNYPLWVFSPGYRETLTEIGLAPDLAKQFHALALATGADADAMLIIEATREDRESCGTGVFYCATRDGIPTVRTVLVPRVHAPTPNNLDGLREMAVITNRWAAVIRRERQLETRAA
jgi:hypothetical protein